jgi:ABC-type phosphate transport system substrate-binding protein
MRALRALILVSVLILAEWLGLARATGTPSFVVIVHPQNAISTVDRKLLANAFLKKVTRWQGGNMIRPVDRAADTPVREHFSQTVHKRSAMAIRAYWQQQIFAGRDVPPPELASDEEVVKYVLQHDGAVGYVTSSAPLNGAKVVRVE